MSRWDVGSSRKRMSASCDCMRTRASMTLVLSPPLSSENLRPAISWESPTSSRTLDMWGLPALASPWSSSSSSLEYSAATSFQSRPLSSTPDAMIPSSSESLFLTAARSPKGVPMTFLTSSPGSMTGSWGRYPILSVREITSPMSGIRVPMSSLMRVVLPTPFLPTRPILSPSSI